MDFCLRWLLKFILFIQYNLNQCYQPSPIYIKQSQINKLQMQVFTLLKYQLLEKMKKQPIKSKLLQTKTIDFKSVVDVYIRNNRKQALLVHISPRTQIQQLHKAVAVCFGIPTHEQVLMFKGKPLKDLLNCRLENKSIIHVIDRRNILPLLKIKIKKPQSHAVQFYSVNSRGLIGDFIQNQIKTSQIQKPFLVYAGRRLKNNRSFSDQVVQNESQLLCLQKTSNAEQWPFELYKYLPKDQIELQDPVESPVSLRNLKDFVIKEKQTGTADNLKNFIENSPQKKVHFSSSEAKLRKIKPIANSSSQSLSKGQKHKKSFQEKQIESSQNIEGSNISEIAAKQHIEDCKGEGEETCIFQGILRGLINESLPSQQKQQINQLNWSEGQLMKIAVQLQKWQEKIQISKTTNKEVDSSLQAIQLPPIREAKNTTILGQTSYFSPIQQKNIESKGPSPFNKHHLMLHKKESKLQDLEDLIMKVENSPAKSRKTNSLPAEIITQIKSMSSQKKTHHNPQSTIMIDVSFEQDHGIVSSTLSKNKKISQSYEQQGLENVQIKKQFYSAKGFQSFTNMYETQIRVSPSQQKITQKQFIFRTQAFNFQALNFYVSMFQAELIQKSINLL